MNDKKYLWIIHVNFDFYFFYSENTELLNDITVLFDNCTTPRCPLKRNTTMHMEIKFKPGLLK